ncbi:hypothetical protein LCGC14_1531540, partial [marine sediment metagenome]
HRMVLLDLRQTHPGQQNVQVTYACPGGLRHPGQRWLDDGDEASP